VLKINNEKELVRFLKIIAENSVAKSKKILEKDPYIKDFKDKQNKNKSIYEQEDPAEDVENTEEPNEEEDLKKKTKADASGADTKKEDDEGDIGLTPAAEKALNLPGYEGQPADFENLLVAINLVRAGNSLKDKEVKTELKTYYDRLTESEKSVLILFLKELAKITTLAVDGDEAQDPSDPSTYFNITKRSEEEKRDKAAKDQSNKVKQQKQDIPKQTANTGPEDTTAPIRVNESQDITQIKKIIEMINS
jgi:hypothetical protein